MFDRSDGGPHELRRGAPLTRPDDPNIGQSQRREDMARATFD